MSNPRVIFRGANRLLLAFALTILIGTILFRSEMATVDEPLSWIDALFTSTSAACVTGLSTIDVGTTLTLPGQIVLLVLIQIGGLGITTVSTFLLVAAGRATLDHHMEAQEQLASIRIKPGRLLWWVVSSTILIEAVGAVVLASRLTGSGRWWSSVFHSVSAFCNSGFSLYPDSLTRFRTDPSVNATIAGLTILGGLGFIVHVQLAAWLRSRVSGRRSALSLHARVVLLGSVVL